MTTPNTNAVEAWPAEVRRAIATGPVAVLSLPTEARRALADVVTRLLTDTPALDRYTAAWRELDRRTPLSRSTRDELRAGGTPVERLCRDGVDALSDRELVALASDPDELELTADLVLDLMGTEDLGQVWREPLAQAARRVGEGPPPDLARRLTDLARTLGDTAPATTPSGERPRRRSYAPALAALAAALLVGVGIGVVAQRQLTDGKRSDEWAALSSKSTVGRVTPRGGDVSFELKLDAPRPGFAAVIVPRVGQPPLVYPEEWGDPPRVAPGEAATYGPLDARAGQDVIVVVTETPASDVLRRAFAKEPPGNGSADGVAERAEAILKAAGFRWAAFSRVTVK